MTTDTTTKEESPFAAALPLGFCGCLERNGCDLNSYGLRGLRSPILHDAGMLRIPLMYHTPILLMVLLKKITK